MQKIRHPLIVVASLISKAPNLGGLCRTCEIFNAELLVVDNLKIKDDPIFQGLAVTADRWMPMLEVKESGLTEYLLKKKEEGYSLLGIEQATNSVSIERFAFPKKSVLVLGKERQGITPNLLPLLDHILEIPQYGVIRSLNVHVSGALIVWEYTKQIALG
ncbi:Alpha/beta knot methyltransferase [Polychytrium aggregatum]|uniref:Alpha/beta knot methyltransferase n=1 Tax=Polychytrium aggregatum TaxID=110093 RepID=UPI0022FEC1ED|nr:Alpha/beta knot methyltransferase [Polychytrium aggregatum]KAI9205429.1 Alpha/beta knot methyltransferase [Polychytrium aggregatum]